jgi:hypothetical protein
VTGVAVEAVVGRLAASDVAFGHGPAIRAAPWASTARRWRFPRGRRRRPS